MRGGTIKCGFLRLYGNKLRLELLQAAEDEIAPTMDVLSYSHFHIPINVINKHLFFYCVVLFSILEGYFRFMNDD
jgi:hypothetical protein